MSTELIWVKSSYSGGAAGECVEVAALSHVVHIRDSKRPQGHQLAVPAAVWARFVRDFAGGATA
ncbi:DUF397 domain-containing protein [Streptomyces nondiastaticus]|uniref:DUF397 domain-containing protein n=1 Tax=Streptomyces nondiastaticus TaxID=3154512 RepID=UPI00342619CC